MAKAMAPNLTGTGGELAVREATAVDCEIRPFRPVDAEYLACLAVQACHPEDPQDTLDEWKYRGQTARKDALRARFVLALGSVIIGYGVVADPHWLDVEGRIRFGHTVHPDYEGLVVDRKPIHDHVERYVLSLIADRQTKVLLTRARGQRGQGRLVDGPRLSGREAVSVFVVGHGRLRFREVGRLRRERRGFGD